MHSIHCDTDQNPQPQRIIYIFIGSLHYLQLFVIYAILVHVLLPRWCGCFNKWCHNWNGKLFFGLPPFPTTSKDNTSRRFIYVLRCRCWPMPLLLPSSSFKNSPGFFRLLPSFTFHLCILSLLAFAWGRIGFSKKSSGISNSLLFISLRVVVLRLYQLLADSNMAVFLLDHPKGN